MIPIRSVDDLMEVAHGYQRSMALFAALRLGVFEALAGGPGNAASIARKVGADPRRLAVLLDGLAAMGLLAKSGGRYRNGEVAREFLAGGLGSKASILLHHLDCWPEWTGLERKIRAGRKGKPKGGDYHENFIRGMDDNARERAEEVARRYPLRAGERVLDLGGGAGTYAIAWAGKYPRTRVTVFDTPDTLRVTRKILKEKGASAAVELIEGDFLADPVGGPYDFVWISHILHAFSERDCLKILRKAKAALARGGRAAVQEFLLNEDKTSPPGPALFGVHMVAVTEGGRSYTAREIVAMMRKAGLRDVEAGPPDPRGVGVITARA